MTYYGHYNFMMCFKIGYDITEDILLNSTFTQTFIPMSKETWLFMNLTWNYSCDSISLAKYVIGMLIHAYLWLYI